jgi:hypothetical protein
VLLKNDPVEGVGSAAADREGEESGADRAAGRQPAEMLGAWAVTGDPKYVVTLRTGSQGAAGRPAALCAGMRLLSGEDANVLKRVNFSGPVNAADEHCPFPTTPRPSPRRWRRRRRPTWRFWRWASRQTGWKARLRAAPPGLHRRAGTTAGGGCGYRQAGDPGGAGRAAAGVEVGRGHVPAILEAWSPGSRPATPWPMCCLAT